MEKFTVIIPTRDRAETLDFAIKSCVEQSYKNFRIIVSDNCSSDNTKEVVAKYLHYGVEYIKPDKRVSMAENFEFSLSHVDAGFVMFIGDDDALIPGCIEYVAEIQRKYKVLAISGQNAEYCWPNFPDPARQNFLKWGSSYRHVELRSSARWIERCLNFKDVYTFDMPKLYHGFVHKSVIEMARSDGTYFNSITPDAYSAFATACCIDDYAFSLRPFTIGGASGKSNGVSGIDPTGKSDESDKFLLENTIEFHRDYICCGSLEIYMAEAFSQFAERFPDKVVDYSVNFENMLRSALSSANSRTMEGVCKAVNEMSNLHGLSVEKKSFKFEFFKLSRFIERVFNRAKLYLYGEIVRDAKAHGVHDVYAASLFIKSRFK